MHVDAVPGEARGELRRDERSVRVENREEVEAAGAEAVGLVEGGRDGGQVQERLTAVEAQVGAGAFGVEALQGEEGVGGAGEGDVVMPALPGFGPS